MSLSPESNGQQPDAVFARGVDAYLAQGWTGVLATYIPGSKIPPKGHTGYNGVDPDAAKIEFWKRTRPQGNLLLRLGPTLIGIDKDAYEGKLGGLTIQESVNRWGPLPTDAWRSTSRIDDPGDSGIYLFKVPEEFRARGEISFKELGIADVEIIQPHHRTACAWPSIHPKTGNLYRWFNRQNELVPEGVVPHVDDHPDLPLEWLRGVANTKANRERERPKDGEADENDLPLYDVEAALTGGRPSQKVAARQSQAVYAIREGKDRHKSTLRHTMALMRFGSNGEAGVAFAIRELNKVFVEVVGPERDGGDDVADAEFQNMIRGAARLLDEGPAEEDAEHGADAEYVSSYPSDSAATPQQSWSGPPPTATLLRNILDEVGTEVRNRGLVGEEKLAKTVYLAMTSRLLDRPVSLGVKGHSASGKSYTVETVTKFFPPEAFLEFTAMSERALVYSHETYAHRTIVIYEVTAMREDAEDNMTSYFIRSLLSEGRIVYDVTVKDRNGEFTTRKVTKEGPTNLIFTTTKTQVHAENETRILSLSTNDSSEQTANVLMAIATEHTGNDLGGWIDFQRWLASDAAEHRVVIPYARELAKLIPAVAVRLRRDFGAVLALIQANAMLHQLSRNRDDQGRIIATVEDYEVVRGLVAKVLTEGAGRAVSDTVRGTVAAVVAVKQNMLEGASTTAIAKHLNIDKSNAGRRLRVAADGGYIDNLETRRGLPARWQQGDPLPDETAVLPEPTQLLRWSQPSDLECCGVAPEKEGYKRNDAPPETGDTPSPNSDGEKPTRVKTPRKKADRHDRVLRNVIGKLTKAGPDGMGDNELSQKIAYRDRAVLDTVLDQARADNLIEHFYDELGGSHWVLADKTIRQESDR